MWYLRNEMSKYGISRKQIPAIGVLHIDVEGVPVIIQYGTQALGIAFAAVGTIEDSQIVEIARYEKIVPQSLGKYIAAKIKAPAAGNPVAIWLINKCFNRYGAELRKRHFFKALTIGTKKGLSFIIGAAFRDNGSVVESAETCCP